MTTDRSTRDAAIADSRWRSRQCGVDPRSCLGSGASADHNRRAGGRQLVAAAAAVLDRVSRELVDTGFVLILGDRQARVVDIRAGNSTIRDRLQRSGITTGRLLAEDIVGTNAIGTVAETRTALTIRGAEHYAEALRMFHSHGHPIVNPATKRLAGVLSISCLGSEHTALLPPFVAALVREIEAELAGISRADDHALVDAFRIGCEPHPDAPVVAIGARWLLENLVAGQLLTPADHVALRTVMDGARRRTVSTVTTSVDLDRGTAKVDIAYHSGGAVLVLDFGSPARVTASPPPLTAVTGQSPVTMIAGEPGTGRTTAARRLAGNTEVAWLHALDASVLAEPSWSATVRKVLTAASIVVIEDVHLLSASFARQLAVAIESRPPDTRLILTAGPLAQLDGEHARLVAQCAERTELPPLRDRRGDIPALISVMLAAGVRSRLQLSAQVIDLLTRQQWPGNLTELATVVGQIARARSCGEITVADVPAPYRQAGCNRQLTPIEHAERNAVVDALRECGGNKQAAASYLGVSRATLYRAIHRYRIEPVCS